MRLTSCDKLPKAYQLLIKLDDDSALVFTVAMYVGIIVHNGSYANEYYEASKKAVSPFSNEFNALFKMWRTSHKGNLFRWFNLLLFNMSEIRLKVNVVYDGINVY